MLCLLVGVLANELCSKKARSVSAFSIMIRFFSIFLVSLSMSFCLRFMIAGLGSISASIKAKSSYLSLSFLLSVLSF